jgi:hypothetical protein
MFWYLFPLKVYLNIVPNAIHQNKMSKQERTVQPLEDDQHVCNIHGTVCKIDWLIDWLIDYYFTSAQEYFTYMETSPLPEESSYARRSRPSSRKGSLSCYTCCDTGPRFFRSHPKGHPIKSPLPTRKRVRRIYPIPDSNGSPNSRLLRHAGGCERSII